MCPPALAFGSTQGEENTTLLAYFCTGRGGRITASAGSHFPFLFRLSTPPSPHSSLSLSRPSFPSGDDRARGSALGQFFVERFAGDEASGRYAHPFPSLSLPAVRNRAPKALMYAVCIRIWPCILLANFDFSPKLWVYTVLYWVRPLNSGGIRGNLAILFRSM